MCPRLVLYHRSEWYRVVTSALLHANLMHLGMNMMTTIGVSTLLEQRLGTLQHLLSTFWAILCTSLVTLGISYALYYLLGETKWMSQHSLGFSGILFYMTVLDCNQLSTTTIRSRRSLFGVVHVPTHLYPWALLILLQLSMPNNLGFLGHLSGILTGTLQCRYGCSPVLLGNDVYLQELESWPTFQWLVHQPNFVATPNSGSSRRHLLFPQESNSLGRSISINGVMGVVMKCVRELRETFRCVSLAGVGLSIPTIVNGAVLLRILGHYQVVVQSVLEVRSRLWRMTKTGTVCRPHPPSWPLKNEYRYRDWYGRND
jgi:membrane associated rhomboid family serine protease